MFWKVTIPQFEEIGNSRAKIEEQKKEIKELNESLMILNTLSEESLNQDFATVNTALPTSKDFLAIYLGILRATSNSGTSLEKFSSKIGTIYEIKEVVSKIPVQKAPVVASQIIQNPSLTISTTVKSPTINEFHNFADEVTKILPIADIKKMNFGDAKGELELLFFYKEYDFEKFAKVVKIQTLSAEQQKLLEELTTQNQ